VCTTQVGFDGGIVFTAHRGFGTLFGDTRASYVDVFGEFGVVRENRDVSA
jgi:hypothetical protein